MTRHHRANINATVDPELLAGVDAYVRQHPERDRNSIINEALWLWMAREQDRAMIEQFDGPGPPEDERRAWNAIRDAAAHEVFTRDRRDDELG